ncbi:MAG: DNA polymerase III subunit delta [Thermoleophilia bacterium]
MSSPSSSEEKKAPLRPAYLILGDDEPKVETALRRLRERIVRESGTDLNIDEFNAAEHSATEVVGAANTMAFLGGVRLVLVHGVESWRKPDKEEVLSYLKAPAPDACLALVGRSLPAKDSLRRAFAEAGDLLEYRAPKPWELPDWTLKQARRLGLNLGNAEAKALVERVGEHQQLVLRELEKLSVYKGRARVTAEDIESLVPKTLEARIFDLIDAVVDGHGPRAFGLVEELYAAGEKPTGLFFRVLRHYQQLARVLGLREEGWPDEQIKSEMGLKPYPAKKLFRQVQGYSPARVRAALGHLAETDARMKGKAATPAELELELCLGRLLALR